jgi:ubiquinol-cytochrome c reductase cytochrome c subunit
MANTLLLTVATVFVVAATPLPVASQTPPQPPAAPASAASAGNAENGKRLYMTQTCYYCHGTVGQGAGRVGARIGPPSRALAGFIRYVRRPSGAMPAITDQVSDQDLTDIYAYLRTIAPAKNPKDIPLLNQLKSPGR